jgi:hypothetical protein
VKVTVQCVSRPHSSIFLVSSWIMITLPLYKSDGFIWQRRKVPLKQFLLPW